MKVHGLIATRCAYIHCLWQCIQLPLINRFIRACTLCALSLQYS